LSPWGADFQPVTENSRPSWSPRVEVALPLLCFLPSQRLQPLHGICDRLDHLQWLAAPEHAPAPKLAVNEQHQLVTDCGNAPHIERGDVLPQRHRDDATRITRDGCRLRRFVRSAHQLEFGVIAASSAARSSGSGCPGSVRVAGGSGKRKRFVIVDLSRAAAMRPLLCTVTRGQTRRFLCECLPCRVRDRGATGEKSCEQCPKGSPPLAVGPEQIAHLS
jgi:hypothetical protein